MTVVQYPDFAKVGQFGQLESLLCKVCGTVIGQVVSKPVDRVKGPVEGVWVEKREVRFERTSEYTEMKIAFDDRSAHVTNGCKRCMQADYSMEELQEIVECDEDDLQLPHRPGKPVAIVQIKVGGGIV